MVNYHPADELLMRYAAGQLSDALGVMLSCHIEACPKCAAKVKAYEALGGDLLKQCEAEPPSENLLEEILMKLSSNDEEIQEEVVESKELLSIPRPLRRFVDKPYDELEWQGMTRSIREFDIPIDDDQYTAKFYRIAAGKKLPEHTHKGNEYVMVMQGSFSDRTCDYKRGDFIFSDNQVIHQPEASMDEDCICFAVMDAPLKMTGLLGRMINPFLR